MTDENIKKLLEEMDAIGQEMQKYKEQYEAENNAWWDGLTEKERQDAFYAVCKRIYQGDIVDRGTYRYVLYDVFGFGPEMYVAGMDCGYMTIHNSIFTAGEKDA
jgi:hypothetical protein